MRFTLVVPLAPERQAPIIGDIKKLDYPNDKYHVVVAQGRNPSLNRNRGIDRVNGEIVVFLDDDAHIDADYLRKVDEFFDEHPEIDVVGGPQLTPSEDGGFARISGYALSSKFGAWKLAGRYGVMDEKLYADENDLTSANLICKKKVVERVRFDEKLFPGEDPKFISDALKEGFRVAYSPEIIVHHQRRPEVGSLVKQIFNYGLARPRKESFFETLKKPFFFIPSLFVVYLVMMIGSVLNDPSITGSVIGLEFSSLSFFWFLPFLAYVLLALLFSLYESLRHGDLLAFFVLPFVFLSIHVSYGVGMLKGYFDGL
jgi:glycosyltransferase involved in cell wall biosynthesis